MLDKLLSAWPLYVVIVPIIGGVWFQMWRSGRADRRSPRAATGERAPGWRTGRHRSPR